MASNKDRQAEFRQRMQARGLAQVTLWAPRRDVDRVRLYAERLVETFEREQRSAEKGGSKES